MMLDDSTISCGVHEISGLGARLDQIVRAVQDEQVYDDVNPDTGDYDSSIEYHVGGAAFYVFSDTVGSGGHRALRDYILKHKLGTVSVSRPKKNPNSGNVIEVCVWNVNHKALRKWRPTSTQR